MGQSACHVLVLKNFGGKHGILRGSFGASPDVAEFFSRKVYMPSAYCGPLLIPEIIPSSHSFFCTASFALKEKFKFK